ncbi:aldo/keto reductase [Chitinophaga sp. Hz27]|uniref:aldo/keto reductase n=1 Tax=Chitinophaga sp. Hz27 TaxID=3347169 RepID=UPI0035D6343C
MTDLHNYRTLGKSGLRVSPLTLGTMTFGLDWGYGASPEDAKGILAAYLEQGGNIIDTANIYTKGHSEKIIGDYLHDSGIRRDSLVLSTKFYGHMHPGDPNSGGNSRKAMIVALEDSLKRLRTDYIDLYWVHAYDPFTPIEETMSALHDVIRAGKVRYIAVSDTPAWKIAQAQLLAEFRGWSSFIGLQVEYSLLERTVEGDLIPMAQEMGLGVMPWSPLKQGVLSGKYTRGNNGQQQSNRAMMHEMSESTYVVLDRLAAIAAGREESVAAVALAWVNARPGVTSTIIGARTMEQLQRNLRSLTISLTAAEIASLDEVSVPQLNFPYPVLQFAGNIGQGGNTINGKPSIRPAILP